MKQQLASKVRIFGFLLLVLLLATFSVSAQEDTSGEEVVILSQVEGPLGIDTVIQIPALQDTYISSTNANTNYGASPTIRMGHNAGGLGALRPIIQFSLNSIPNGATINSATMRIYLYSATVGDPSMPFQARHLSSSWNELLVTWNSHQPEWGAIIDTGSAPSTPLGWQETDVTTLVRDWYLGNHANNGFTAIADERPGGERQRLYYSKDAGNGLYPRLIVDYTVPPPDTTPPSASVSPLPSWSLSSFTVRWDGSDNQGGSGIAYFDVQYRINSGAWTNWRMRTTQKSAVFAGGVHNALHEFRARAVDRAGNVQPWTSAQASTRVDSVAPTTSMTPLDQYTTSASFVVNWQGYDSGSGIATYDLDGRLNNGPWQRILSNTSQTNFLVSGLLNGDFVEFRVRARDIAGNAQTFPQLPQASTTVVLEPLSVVKPFIPLVMKPTDAVTDTFTVQWVGYTVPNTTIVDYDLRYRFKPNNGSFGAWTDVPLPSPTAQSVEFNGPFTEDGVYEFEVRATNSIAQTEAFTGQAEAKKIIDLQEPFIDPLLIFPLVARQSPGG